MEAAAPLIKILVVEDDPATGFLLEHILVDAGYSVVAVVVSAQEALLSVELLSPDLILMDIHVRGSIDGIAAASQIREEWRLPVIFVTGLADPETLQRACAAKPFGYIVKPVSAPTLLTAIEIALFRHHAEKEECAEREWLLLLLNTISHALIATDSGDKVTFLNKKATSLTGCAPETVLGKPMAEFIHLRNSRGEDFTLHLIEQTKRAGQATLPHGATIGRWNCTNDVPVEGDTLSTFVDATRSGMILSLREAVSHHIPAVHKAQEEPQLVIVRVLWATGRGLLALGKMRF